MTASTETSFARSTRWRRRLYVLVALIFALVFALTSLGLSQQRAWAADEPRLTIMSLSPEVYSGVGPVTIGMQLSDPSLMAAGLSGAPTDISVDTFLQPTPFISVESFQGFLSGAGFPGWQLSNEELSASSLAADGSFSITIAGEQLPWLDPQTTGSRGLTVQVTVGDLTVEARTALIYQPVDQEVQTDVNLTVSSPVEADFFSDSVDPTRAKSLQDEAKTVASLAQIPGVSLAVLPGFFTGLDGRSSVRQVYPRFKDYQDQILSSDLELVSLPSQNADLSLLAATSQAQLLGLAGDSRATSLAFTDPAWRQGRARVLDGVTFASDAGFTQASLATLSNEWPGITVIAPSAWSAQSQGGVGADQGLDTSLTPTARLQIDPQTGLLAGASAGSDESPGTSGGSSVTVIDQWSLVSDLLNRPVGSAGDELQVRQTLRTATLLVGLEDPADRRTLFAVADVSRETSGDAMIARAEALLGTSWVHPVPLSQVLSSLPSEIERLPVPDSTIDNDAALLEIAGQFDQLSLQYGRALSVQASSPTHDASLLDPYIPAILAPTETGLLIPKREALITEASEKLRAITDTIDVLPISQLNIVNTTSDFLVSVRNTGQFPLSVVVSLFPSDPRLQAAKPADAVIPANSMVGVSIPVTAVGSGDIDVRIHVTTKDGTILDDSQTVPVRVRANWEDTGTIIVGTLLTLLFVFGIVRTVRKGRRRNSGMESDDSPDQSPDQSPDEQDRDPDPAEAEAEADATIAGTAGAPHGHIFRPTQGGEA